MLFYVISANTPNIFKIKCILKMHTFVYFCVHLDKMWVFTMAGLVYLVGEER